RARSASLFSPPYDGYAPGSASPPRRPPGRLVNAPWSLTQQRVRGLRIGGTMGVRGARGGISGHSAPDALQHVLADEIVAGKPDRVLPVETCPAQPGGRLLGRGDETGQ